MADKTLSSVIGGSSLPKMAPELTFFSNKPAGASLTRTITGIDASSALTEVLGLTGAFSINFLNLQGMIVNDMTDIRLTIDGVVIWDETGLTVNAAVESLISEASSSSWDRYRCDASFSLEVQMATDTDITTTYQVRPIL